MAEVTELTPKTDAEHDDPPPAPAKSKGGRPPKGSQRPPDARQPQFFDAVAAVPKEDWGTRAFMYVYADEPVCKAKTFGSTRYLMKSSVPIYDLEGLKEDYGSFKGWMSLNLRKTGKDQTAEVDRLDFEIYDPKHPPKIPRAAWANDNRNDRWIALLPPEPPPANAAASSLMEGARFYKEIRQEFKEEMADGEPDTPPTDQTRSTLETMKLAKELFAQPAPAPVIPTKDPLEIAVALATTMMQMKADNPVIDMYRDELKAMREELKEANAEMRKRQEAPAKDMLTQFIEFASSDKFETVKKVLGFGSDTPARVGRTTAYDVVRDIASSPFGANLGQGLGMLLSNLAQSGAQAAQQNGAPRPTMPTMPPVLNAQQSNGTIPPVESPEQRITRIGQLITQPMLYEFFLKDESGETFAERMFDMWPEDYIFMRNLGPENIVARYRQFPPAWGVIQPKEPAFITFIQEFCAWNPNEDDGPAPPGNGPGTIDLDSEAGA